MAPVTLSDNGPFATLPKEPMQYAVDNQLLAVLIVLPIFAYPLLPSVGRSGIRCEIFLVWSSLLGIAILKTAAWAEIAPGLALGELWQGALLITTAAAGIEGLCAPRRGKAEPRDFHYAALVIQGFSILGAIDWFQDVVFPEAAEAVGWPFYIFRLLIIVFGCLPIGLAFLMFLEIYARDVIHGFTTRRVSWWPWLPENGAAEDFGPAWSIALAIAVGLAPVAMAVIVVHAWQSSVLL